MPHLPPALPLGIHDTCVEFMQHLEQRLCPLNVGNYTGVVCVTSVDSDEWNRENLKIYRSHSIHVFLKEKKSLWRNPSIKYLPVKENFPTEPSALWPYPQFFVRAGKNSPIRVCLCHVCVWMVSGRLQSRINACCVFFLEKPQTWQGIFLVDWPGRS